MPRDARIVAIETEIRSAHFGIENAYTSLSGPGAFYVVAVVKASADCGEVREAIAALFARGFAGWSAGLQAEIAIRQSEA